MDSIVGKRFAAYLLDAAIVTLLFGMVAFLIPDTYNATVLEKEQDQIMESYVRQELETEEYYNEYATVSQSLDIERFRFNAVNFLFVIAYFGIFPIYFKKRTLGMKFVGLEFKRSEKKEKVEIKYLVFRAFLLKGLVFSLIGFIIMGLISPLEYLIMMAILALAQFILVIVNSYMIIYSEDKRGIIDKISKTDIVSAKER